MNEPTQTIDLGALYQRLVAEWRAAQLKEAELRGQVALLEQLISQAQRPMLSGDPLLNGDAPDTAPPALG